METENRLHLVQKSSMVNKKVTRIVENRNVFVEKVQEHVKQLQSSKSPSEETDNDITVCVRVRPMLEYEEEANYFDIMHCQDGDVHVLEPRFTVRNVAKLMPTSYKVDLAFGPETTNDEIYERMSDKKIIETGLKGGISTIFAYGQTGSGKTFTITGLLGKLTKDLFDNKDQSIELYLSMFEILGNHADLMEDNEKRVDLLEDKFGHVNVINVEEKKIQSLAHFQDLIRRGFERRHTASTFKNDTSSRSHAICQIRVKNTHLKEIEDGKIFVIDLAGSESASDSLFHDKKRVQEAQGINLTLMCLKDCIRNRALASLNVDKYFHVPYRSSMLTLLLKEAFEMESRKLCKTVVIATVSPTVADVSQSLNTLRYVTPLKIGQAQKDTKSDFNPKNPANWTNAQLREWTTEQTNGKMDLEKFCPFESGMQILRVPEADFVCKAIEAHPSWSEKAALSFYKKLWGLLIDARTKNRKQKLKCKDPWRKRMTEHDQIIAEGN